MLIKLADETIPYLQKIRNTVDNLDIHNFRYVYHCVDARRTRNYLAFLSFVYDCWDDWCMFGNLFNYDGKTSAVYNLEHIPTVIFFKTSKLRDKFELLMKNKDNCLLPTYNNESNPLYLVVTHHNFVIRVDVGTLEIEVTLGLREIEIMKFLSSLTTPYYFINGTFAFTTKADAALFKVKFS